MIERDWQKLHAVDALLLLDNASSAAGRISLPR